VVKAYQNQLLEKLPNVLMLSLKRFIYTGRIIKKKEMVYFEDVLHIEDHHVSPQSRLGIFNQKAQGTKRSYRLFSVVEHIGKQGNRGHYVCYTLDNQDEYIRFDDKNFRRKDWEDLKDGVQAYMLFYELIREWNSESTTRIFNIKHHEGVIYGNIIFTIM